MKIGVIGFGYWGPNIVRNFQLISGCQTAMVADLSLENLKKAKELYPNIAITQNYKDILVDPQILAVAIVTPLSTHYSLIKESLLAGKHVFTEKPLVTNSKQGEELVKLADKEKKVLMVGHTFEYNLAIRKIKEILNSGELGRLLFFYSKRVSLGPIRSDTSVIWDFAFHDISIITYLLEQAPKRVFAWGKAFLKEGLEDFGFINLEFLDNIAGHIRVGWLYPIKERGMTIVGDKKFLVFDDINKEKPLTIYNSDLSASYPEVEQGEPLAIECRHFIDCIEKSETPLTDGKRGLEIIKILEALQKSLNSDGKPVNV